MRNMPQSANDSPLTNHSMPYSSRYPRRWERSGTSVDRFADSPGGCIGGFFVILLIITVLFGTMWYFDLLAPPVREGVGGLIP